MSTCCIALSYWAFPSSVILNHHYLMTLKVPIMFPISWYDKNAKSFLNVVLHILHKKSNLDFKIRNLF